MFQLKLHIIITSTTGIITMAGVCVWQWGVHGGGHVWQRHAWGCMAGGAWQGACVAGACMAGDVHGGGMHVTVATA